MNTPTIRRFLAIQFLCAAVFFALSACHSDSNENDIKPVRARVTFKGNPPPPEPVGPAVVVRVAASDAPDDDLVPLDVVLKAGGTAVDFDAFDLEILPISTLPPGTYLPGVVRLAYDSATGTTPWGPCGTCVRTQGCGTTVCGACSPCPDPVNDPLLASVLNPVCASGTSGSGSFLVSVNFAPASLCTSASVSAGNELVIARVTAFVQSVGTVQLKFIDSQPTGDSDILTFPPSGPPVPVNVLFDNREIIFTASR